MMILCKNYDTGQRSYTFSLFNDGGTLKLQAIIDQDGDGVTRDIYRWNWTPSTSTWYHLALTITPGNASATTFEVFIDGVSQGNGTAVVSGNVSGIFNGTAPFQIGCNNQPGTPDQFFDGKIDEVRVWNTVRTSTQINDNKGVRLTGSESNLQAYWPFEALVSVGGAFLLLFT